jgi:hypothetical protein
MRTIGACLHLCRMALTLGGNTVAFLGAVLRSRTALAAENLFLWTQLALYRERQVTPRWARDATRVALVLLARCFD